ncbi:MAG: hypothetical protein R2789_02070 [Microthrixaceae bacterium]
MDGVVAEGVAQESIPLASRRILGQVCHLAALTMAGVEVDDQQVRESREMSIDDAPRWIRGLFGLPPPWSLSGWLYWPFVIAALHPGLTPLRDQTEGGDDEFLHRGKLVGVGAREIVISRQRSGEGGPRAASRPPLGAQVHHLRSAPSPAMPQGFTA